MEPKLNILQLYWLVLCFVSCIFSINVISELSITLQEKQTLDKFRNKVLPILPDEYMKTDFYLIRWLRAKNFNIHAAEIMLSENLKWRLEQKMVTILSENFEDMKMDFPSSSDTYDRTGRPIGTIEMSQWSIRNAIVTGRGERLVRYIYMLVENSTSQVIERQKRGMNVTQWISLMHAEGITMTHHGCAMCVRTWIKFLYALENYYPGWMKEFVAIDASPALNVIISIANPFASSYVTKNVHVFGSERMKWMKYLDSRISRSERRELYGGTKQ